MPHFDSELYLRLLGERELTGAEPRGRHGNSALADAATALVAVGAIRRSRAEAVLADYETAEWLRTGEHMHFRFMGPRHNRSRGRAKPLEPMRVVPCAATIDDGQMMTSVAWVTLSASRTELAVTVRQSAGALARSGPRGHAFGLFGGPSATPQPIVVDDRGTSSATQFSGGGSDAEWTGQLIAETPLAPDTRWIELDGQRIALSAEPWPCQIELETLPARSPAERHLWNRVAAGNHFHGPPLETLDAPIDALLAAGALTPDDPVIADARAVAEAMPHHPGMPRSGTTTPLPEPWRSLLRRQGRMNGPEADLVIGALVPPFDGFSVAILALRSHPGYFEISVEVSPGPGHGPRGDLSLGQPELEWWAEDDRGNPYLGQFGGWSGSDVSVRGEIQFTSALPARARWVKIMPTGTTSRGVVTVGLPRGEQAGRAAA